MRLGTGSAGLSRAFLATLCWSSSALLIDRITSAYGLSPLQISAWRVLLVLPILAALVYMQVGTTLLVTVRDVPWYLFAGLGIAVSNVSWAASVQMNRPAAAAALGFSAPAFIAIVERIVFGRRLSRYQAAAIAVNLAGCGLAAGIRGPEELLHAPGGLLVGLANGLAFTWYTLLNSHGRRGNHVNPNVTLFIVFAVSEIGVAAWGLPVEGWHLVRLHVDVVGWCLLLALGAGPTMGAYLFFNSSLRVLPATVASLVTTLEPPIVAIFALVLLGRPVNKAQWVGIVLIVTAVLAMQMLAAKAPTHCNSHER